MFKKIHSLQLAKTRKSGKKGFTLVELVIVIAVLAIIAAIAIPTVNGVVKNANAATDASNQQAIQMTIKTFASQNEARVTHKLEGAVKALTGSSTIKELFAAYGTTLPKVKANANQVFIWTVADQSVSIGAISEADGSTKINLNLGMDTSDVETDDSTVASLGITVIPNPAA